MKFGAFMRTDTDRLNWLIENEAYSLLDSDNYGPEWFERSRFELVRETIDIAMDAPIAEEEAKVIHPCLPEKTGLNTTLDTSVQRAGPGSERGLRQLTTSCTASHFRNIQVNILS